MKALEHLILPAIFIAELLFIGGCQFKHDCDQGTVRVWRDKEKEPEVYLDLCHEDWDLAHDQ